MALGCTIVPVWAALTAASCAEGSEPVASTGEVSVSGGGGEGFRGVAARLWALAVRCGDVAPTPISR